MTYKDEVRLRRISMLKTAFGFELMQLMYNKSVIEIMLNPDGTVHCEMIGRGKFITSLKFNAQEAENIVKIISLFQK